MNPEVSAADPAEASPVATSSPPVWERFLPHVVILGVVAALYGPGFVTGGWHVYRDALAHFLPSQEVLSDAVSAGEIPFMNPWIWGGIPFASVPGNGRLYPLRWLSLAFDPPRALHVYLIGHALIAGYGSRFLAGRLGASPAGQALAGGLLPASGYLLSMQEVPGIFTGTSWIPWSLGFALALGEGPKARWVWFGVALAASLAAPMYSGDPQASLVGGVLAVALLVSALGARRGLTYGVGVGALSLAFAAAVLLPSFLFVPYTTRSAPFPYPIASLWSTHPWRALELAIPWPWGSPFPEFEFQGRALLSGDRFEFWADTLYLGPLAVVLGIWGLARASVRPWVKRTLIAALVLLGALALGRHTPLHRVFYWVAGSLRYPEKFMAWVTVLLAAGAGQGLTAFHTSRRGVAWAAGALALGASLLVFGDSIAAASGAAPEAIAAGGMRAASLLALVGALAVARRRRAGVILVVGLLALLDPVQANRRRFYLVAEDPLGGRPAILEVLEERLRTPDASGMLGRAAVLPLLDGLSGLSAPIAEGPGRFQRVLASRQATGVVGLVPYRLRTVGGFAGFNPRRAVAAIRAFEERSPRLYSRLLATRVGIAVDQGRPAPEGFTVLRRFPRVGLQTLAPVDPLPGAWLVDAAGTAVCSDQAQALEWVAESGFDPLRHTVLEGGGPGSRPAPLWSPQVPIVTGGVTTLEQGPQRLVFDVTVARPATLLVSRLHLPGWSCTVDGVSSPVSPASAVILGVRLDPGAQRVVLEYRPPGLWAGTLVSLLTWVWVLGGAFALRRLRVEPYWGGATQAAR